MSGWDASSRPSWDSQGEAGENTQAFGAPDFADDGGGFPSSTSPGTPPPIFLQDYDQTDFAPDFGLNDFGQSRAGQPDLGQPDFGPDFGHPDFGQPAPGRTSPGRTSPGRNNPGQNGFGHDEFRRGGFGQDETPMNGFGQDEFRQNGQRGPGQRGRVDNPRQGARDYGAGDYPAPDQADPRGYTDPERAARLDPALRDFFDSQSARQDPARQDLPRQDPGQQRYGTRGYPGQGNGRGPGPARGPAPVNGHRQPGAPPRTGPSRWDAPAPGPGPRPGPGPGSRTARRQASRSDRNGYTAAAVAIGIVVLIGIVAGAYMLLHHKPAAPSSQGAPTGAPTYSAPATKPASTPAAGRATVKAGYKLTTPASAGGYARLAAVPTAVRTVAGATSKAIHDAAVADGAKVTGQVTAGYQLSGGQVLAFTGFNGTFNPAKIMASLATLVTGSHKYSAGPHGGMFACATAPGSPSGTVCLWVTTTTMGVTEFFASNDVPEVVTDQSKAAADTVKLRGGVEKAKA